MTPRNDTPKVRALAPVALALAALAVGLAGLSCRAYVDRGGGVYIEPNTVQVPSLAGLDQRQADYRLRQVRLSSGEVRLSAPRGVHQVVVGQNPEAGSVVPVGSYVSYTLAPKTAEPVPEPQPLQRVPVPSLLNLSEADARETLEASGLAVGLVTWVPAPQARGTVLSQNPDAGAFAAVGAPVSLALSSGPQTRMVAVPNVAGLPLAAAEAQILRYGLVLGEAAEAPSATVREGCVIAQDPPAGAAVPAGSPVTLTISAGTPTPMASVPDLSGQSLHRAQSLLRRYGLSAGTVTQAPSATVRANFVITQDPPPGAAVPSGSVVNLVVSSGAPVRTVAVPNVVPLPLPAAEVAIARAGLVLGEVRRVPSVHVPLHCVVSQDPPAGEAVPPGTAVNLAVASVPAKRFVAVPQLLGAGREEAERRLARAGLALGEVGAGHSESYAAGTVMEQSPAAGSQAEEGTPVSILISRGLRRAAVPRVVGLPFEAGKAALLAAGFTLGRVAEQEVAGGAAGQIVDQNPNAGTLADRGAAVDLIVAVPRRGNPVPAVVGLTLEQATARLVAAGFAAGQVTRQDPGPHGIANNTVIDQSPEADTFAPPGARVNLVIAWRERQQVRVPNLHGRDYGDAVQELSNLGLVVGRRENRAVAPGQVNKVIDQDPAPNSRVFEGTAVNLVVGVQEAEPLILVPSCLMQSERKAVEAIQAAGLDAKVKHVIGIPRGRVIFQFPPPGTPVKKGSNVTIHVTK